MKTALLTLASFLTFLELGVAQRYIIIEKPIDIRANGGGGYHQDHRLKRNDCRIIIYGRGYYDYVYIDNHRYHCGDRAGIVNALIKLKFKYPDVNEQKKHIKQIDRGMLK